MNLNNLISLNKFTLNISGSSKQGISFNKGEILKGQIKELKDNGLVSIFIKGKVIEAFTEVMINKGQQLFLMVDDIRDGRVVLKVLTPEMVDKLENNHLSSTLKEMGFPADDKTLLFAKKLIQYNLPVTAQTLKSMAKGVSFLGEASSKNVETVALALSKNLPLNEKTLPSLIKFIDGNQNLAKLTKDILAIINQIDKTFDSTNELPPSIKFPQTTYSNLKEGSITTLPDSTVETKVVDNSSLFINKNNIQVNKNNIQESLSKDLSQENKNILHNISNLTTILDNEQGNANITQPGLNSVTKDVIMLLKQLTETILLPLSQSDLSSEEQVEKLVLALRNNLVNEGDVVRGINLIKDVLMLKEEPMIEKAVITTLISKLEDMEREIIGQRIFNYMAKFSWDNNPEFYYMSFPIKINEEHRLCQLRIEKDVNNKVALNQLECIKFIVSLETGRLGLILFHVEWNKTMQIKLQGVVETQIVHDHISSNIDSLIKALEGQGYFVDYNGIKVAQTNLSLRLEFKEDDDYVKPFIIDIRI